MVIGDITITTTNATTTTTTTTTAFVVVVVVVVSDDSVERSEWHFGTPIKWKNTNYTRRPSLNRRRFTWS